MKISTLCVQKVFRNLSLTTVLTLILLINNTVCAQSLEWAKRAGGINSDTGTSIAVDNLGNMYVTGHFWEVATFDEGEVNETTLVSSSYYDNFIAKYNNSGNLVWAKRVGDTLSDACANIAVDGMGNIYLTSRFLNSATFGKGGANETTLVSAGNYDIFVAKYDNSGNFVWAKRVGGTSIEYYGGLAVDASGNCFVTGSFLYSAVFGEGEANETILSTSSLSSDYKDLFIAKYDSNGNLVWAKREGGTRERDHGHGVVVDSMGNCYLTGVFSGTATFGEGDANETTLVFSSGYEDMFIAKYNSSGSLIWAKSARGTKYEEAYSIAVDTSGNAFVTGIFSDYSSMTFGSGETNETTLVSSIYMEAFTAKYDSNGNFLWAKKPDGEHWDVGSSIAADGMGNCYVTGTFGLYRFNSSVTFGVGEANETTLVSAGNGDIFIVKYDTNGNLVWAKRAGGSNGDYSQGIAVNASGNCFVTGSFSGVSTIFGEGDANETSLASAGSSDIFIAKYSSHINQPVDQKSATFGSPNSNPGVPFSNDPINLVTGNYVYQWHDLEIPSQGLPLAIARNYNSMDLYSGPLGHGWTHSFNVNLTETLSGDVVVMRGDGRRDFYSRNSDGTFDSPLGNYTHLVAHPDGRFTLKHKDQTYYDFDADGRFMHVRDRNGNTQILDYDSAGNLVSITDTVGRVIALTYDSDNRITSITDPIGRTIRYTYDTIGCLVAVTDPSGATTSYKYYDDHRLLTVTNPVGNVAVTNTYDDLGRVLHQTDAVSNTTTFTYDPENQRTIEKDPLGRETVYTYNENSLLVEQTDAGGVTTFGYDANKNRTDITDPNSHTSTFVYDTQGNIIQLTDALGGITKLTFDDYNNLLSHTDALGRTNRFGYDGAGNMSSITDALGVTTSLAYDAIGQLVGVKNANGETISYEYDDRGNLTAITDPLRHAMQFTYDAVGRLTGQTDANGHSLVLAYDVLDRITSLADPLGNSASIAYDANGNPSQVTDANGQITGFAYDARNRLIRVIDALKGVVSYTYDVGKLVSMTDANGHKTAYAYDALDRLIRETDPLGNVINYNYDAVGNRTQMTDAKGQLTTYIYDALNHLTGISYSDSSAVAYGYDAAGNRIKMVDVTGTTTYTYDALNRLTAVTFPGAKTVTYAYDALGNRLGLTYPDGLTASYKYDAANRLAKVTDWKGKVTSYNYDAADNLIRIAYPNDAAIEYIYDAANRLIEPTNFSRSAPFAHFVYNLDSVGNRISVDSDDDGQTIYYTYDALYRLTGVTAPNTKQSFTYDSMGNRLSMIVDGRVTSYDYDAGDRLLTADNISYDYDANGNRIAKQESNKVTTYTYDAADRLIEVSGPMAQARFTYDGDGNRVQVRIGDDDLDDPGDDISSYAYVWDVASKLPVALTEAGPEGTTTHLYSGLSLLLTSGPDYRNYYHYDGLGSVVGLTNHDGVVKRTYTYDAWGNPTSAPGLLMGENKFGFTGEQWDGRTGLLYLRARYYDPSVGRFISRDPFPGYSYDPSSLNRRVYVANNPTNFVDPSGHLRFKDVQRMSVSELVAVLRKLPSLALYFAPQSTWINYFSGPFGRWYKQIVEDQWTVSWGQAMLTQTRFQYGWGREMYDLWTISQALKKYTPPRRASVHWPGGSSLGGKWVLSSRPLRSTGLPVSTVQLRSHK